MNIAYVQDFVANFLCTVFLHLTENKIKIMVEGLFNLNRNIPHSRTTLMFYGSVLLGKRAMNLDSHK